MAKNPIAKERRAIDRTESQLRADRRGDYKWATSNIDAIYARLGRKVGRSRGRFTAASRRIVGKMEELAARQAEQGRQVKGAQGAAVNAYGGALADVARRDFGTARATAGAGARVAGGQAQAGARIAKTGLGLIDMAASGAKEAAAGADYAASQALSERTNQDVALIAQQRHDLAMAEIQQQFALQAQEREFELYKKKLRFEQNLVEKQLGAEEGGTLIGNAQDLSDSSAKLREVFAQDDSMTPAEAVEAAGLLEGKDPTVYEPVYTSLATYIKSGGTYGDEGTRQDEVNAIMNTLRDHYQRSYSERKKQLEKLIKANLAAIYTRPASPDDEETTFSLGGGGPQVFGRGAVPSAYE